MDDDTIAAISTPLGEGGIGIVRLSGRDALPVVGKLFSTPRGKRLERSGSRTFIHGFIKDPLTGAAVDEVLVAVMRTPKTYTREDVVEIHCHGGILPLRKVLELALKNGARLAEPGEFTKRAFLNGRIDLSQAEAVMDLIRAKTEESGRVALEQLSGGLSEKIAALQDEIASVCAHVEAYIDFPEEEIEPDSFETMLTGIGGIREGLAALSASFEEGRFFREGLKVAIVGRPNVGKSSLLNALLKRDRAIVTETAGTTRDVIEEYLDIGGLPARIMDTAGIRETHEMAEKEGVLRSLRAIEDADVVIGMIDGTCPPGAEDRVVLQRLRKKRALITVNKSDLPQAEDDWQRVLAAYSENIVNISARTGTGLGLLKEKILHLSLAGGLKTGAKHPCSESTGAIVTNLRHKIAIDRAAGGLDKAAAALQTQMPLEIVAIEMREALDRLGEIVGAVTTEDILNRIFNEFCVGK
ncbi:MAG: tRNA uridine-5-carboxymethylaminomethyl(34) synthesis GTPase MnmE [Nitrospirae bacterium]|nr:tRNA uridine-5-carboxymethylaminomethyl(34) synthesis GTPase MnmE [Nitrospirota bacterium]